MPSVSFCIATLGPASRVRALLELVRPHVDEIVLAVDRTGDPSVLESCADLADRRLSFEHPDSPSRLVGWILHQCSCDWILRLDDDEVPSGSLLEALPDLVVDRYPTQITFDRRWLFPDDQRYIVSEPWRQEFQMRLLRNVPGLWGFDGVMHDDGHVLGERRMTDLPLYHCDLLVKSLEDRQAKSLRYEGLRPDLRFDNFPVNAMYLPELRSDLKTAPVPAADVDQIRRLLTGGRPTPAGGSLESVEEVERAEIYRYTSHRVLGETAYRASVRVVDPPAQLPAGLVCNLEVTVTNEGDDRWPWGEHITPLIRLGYRWRHTVGDEFILEGRGLFTETVRPGQTTRLLLGVNMPATPGTYALEVDVLHEHVRWFGCEARLEVAVEPPEPIAGFVRSWPAPGEMPATTLVQENVLLHNELRHARLKAAGALEQLALAGAPAPTIRRIALLARRLARLPR